MMIETYPCKCESELFESKDYQGPIDQRAIGLGDGFDNSKQPCRTQGCERMVQKFLRYWVRKPIDLVA